MSKFHLHVPPNRFGRDFIIGDLHGHVAKLDQALSAARFMPGRDRLFSVGDLIDRGPDSPAALALVKNRWFYAVRGNHEDLLLRAVAGNEPETTEVWQRNGGDWALENMRPNAAAREAAPLCAELPWAITLHHKDGRLFGICHAQSPVRDWNDIDAAEHTPELRKEMLWARDRVRQSGAPQVSGVDWTIHGHCVVAEPLYSGNAIFIETGCFKPQGRLTLLCLDDIA